MKSNFRNGIVRQVDSKRGLARVEFTDQDGVTSWWLNVNQQVTSDSKSYAMPEVGAQVNCLTDDRGEEGTILGAMYSDVDQPPTDNANLVMKQMKGGRKEVYDKESGTYNVKQTAPYTIEIGAARVEITANSISLTVGGAGLVIGGDGTVKSTGNFSQNGDAEFKNGTLRHNNKNVGSDHHHSGVRTGDGQTGDPLP